jgi:hypothetical protein
VPGGDAQSVIMLPISIVLVGADRGVTPQVLLAATGCRDHSAGRHTGRGWLRRIRPDQPVPRRQRGCHQAPLAAQIGSASVLPGLSRHSARCCRSAQPDSAADSERCGHILPDLTLTVCGSRVSSARVVEGSWCGLVRSGAVFCDDCGRAAARAVGVGFPVGPDGGGPGDPGHAGHKVEVAPG